MDNSTIIWNKFAKTGKPELYKEIYLDNYHSVFFLAYNILGNQEPSHDLAQDIFASLYRNRKKASHQNIRHFNAWLKALTTYECFHRKKTGRKILSLDELENEPVYDDPNILLLEDSSEEKRNLMTAVLRQLKQKNYREIIELSMSGKSNDEIAEILGKSKKYVADRKSLAKRELITLLRK
ncbi:MAG: sigma-70 family RNA polymerase sigma factor [Bacteroidota bacterium]